MAALEDDVLASTSNKRPTMSTSVPIAIDTSKNKYLQSNSSLAGASSLSSNSSFNSRGFDDIREETKSVDDLDEMEMLNEARVECYKSIL